MPVRATSLVVERVPARQLVALRRKASALGVSPEVYVRRLIARDLELDRLARSASLARIAAPFREALGELPDAELDAIVDAARTDHHKRRSRKR